MMKNSLFITFLVASLNFFGQSKILLINGILHNGKGEISNSATIGIEYGKIKFVRNSLAYTFNKKDWDTIIDLENQHVYPGFVAPNSTLGLTEIDAVRATNDFNEVGEYNPHIRALIAYNVESKVISTVRTNGVLLTQATPRGGVISGSSSVLHLGGWSWEEAVVKSDDGIHLNWPVSVHYKGWNEHEKKEDESSKYLEEKAQVYQFFKMAKNYAETNKKQDLDLRFAAMKNLFEGNKRLYIHANEIQQLMDIIDFVKEFGIKFPVIIGGYDSYLITERIKDANIPIMLPRIHSLPMNEDDPIDLPYRLPSILYKAGIKFCLQNEGDMEAMNARNLPFLAGTAAAYGIPDEEALKTITLNTCEILGIEKDYGSVEAGKRATLFVSTGNALDMRTNNVTMILMNGQFVSPSNSQKELYQKYKKRYKL